MARTFTYKGKTLEQLQAMNTESFSKLIKSRNRRAIKRMSTSYKELIVKVERIKKEGAQKLVKTATREAVVLPGWVGLKFGVYNGKQFTEVNIVPEMIGHRLGEYAYTVKHVVHSAPGIRATRGSKFLAVK